MKRLLWLSIRITGMLCLPVLLQAQEIRSVELNHAEKISVSGFVTASGTVFPLKTPLFSFRLHDKLVYSTDFQMTRSNDTITGHLQNQLTLSYYPVPGFLPGWKKASLKFVPAGKTLDNQPVDSDPEIIHVDTGLGKFDHHQKADFTCAAKKVYLWLKKEGNIPKKLAFPLERIVNYVTETDHFKSVDYPQPTSDRYNFCLSPLIEGLKSQFKTDNETTLFTF